jgi:hypothetical protein
MPVAVKEPAMNLDAMASVQIEDKRSAQDKLFDKLTALSEASIVTKYNSDYIFQYEDKIFCLSDFLTGQVKAPNASEIVLSNIIRQKIRVADKLVIPEIPVKGMWNIVNNISSATSSIAMYTNSASEVIKKIEDEFGDWNSVIYRRGNAIPDSPIVGFSIQPGRLSPTWIPLLQSMATQALDDNESIKAYQLIFSNMFYNRVDLKKMSLKEAELIRAGALLETLCSAPQGTMKYCMSLNHVCNSLDMHVQAMVKVREPDNSRKKIVRAKFKNGKNPFVSYAGKGNDARARLQDVINAKRANNHTKKPKYKDLADYEKKEIAELFAKTSRCSMPESLTIHTFSLNRMNVSKDAKRTGIRVSIPTILKSQSGYYVYTKNDGFGDRIIKPNLTASCFSEETLGDGAIDGKANINKIKETAKQSSQTEYSYTMVPEGGKALTVAVEFYKKLGKLETYEAIVDRKLEKQRKFSSQREKKQEEATQQDDAEEKNEEKEEVD